MHLDLKSDDLDAEVRRLEALGATRYDHQQERGYDIWVLRDPWANEFCVLQINFPTCSPSDRPGPTDRGPERDPLSLRGGRRKPSWRPPRKADQALFRRIGEIVVEWAMANPTFLTLFLFGLLIVRHKV